MSAVENYKFYEWDEETFVLPDEYILDENSDLSDALNVFYLAGGCDFFNVIEPKYYADNWLNFIGDLYRAIVEERYDADGSKQFAIPLSGKQKQELYDRGVPSVFVTDIE